MPCARAHEISDISCHRTRDDVASRWPIARTIGRKVAKAHLTLATVAINGWNRLNIAFRTIPGTYQVMKSHADVAGSCEARLGPAPRLQ